MTDRMDNTETPPDGLAEAQARADALERRLVQAELKAEAVRAGMIDLDGLKLLDISAARLTEAGEVEGAGALMAQLRRDKPWLFGTASSSATTSPPPPATPVAKRATEMTDAEYRAARADLIKRRF